MFSRVVVAALVTLFLTAGQGFSEENLTERQKDQVAEVVKDALKDPESARFKWDMSTFDVSPTNGSGEVCLKVNAKNSYGGYVGFKTVWTTFFRRNNKLENIRVVSMGGNSTEMSCNNIREIITKYKYHDPRVTDDQARAGCSIMYGKLYCLGPGTGMCWEKGHDPWKGEAPARSIDIGNDPSSANFDHPERCG